jgi:hypothetical protein
MTSYLLHIKNGFGIQTAFDDVEVFETPDLREERIRILNERHKRLSIWKLDREPLTDINAELRGYHDFTDTGILGDRDDGWEQVR